MLFRSKGIDFSIERGEVLSIIGSSGSGKTTLLRCINFLEVAQQGRIFVDGKLIFDADTASSMTHEEKRENQGDLSILWQSKYY